jgi:hypothetical protein
MEKMVFKNEILNIVIGSILIIFAFVGYLLNLVQDQLPIIVAVVLILLSTKRFLYSFNKIISKNATLILVIEFILDLIFAGLLIYLGSDYVGLFLGLIIYSRGVSYLIINYVATRKVDLTQYIVNILYVTFGSFLIFTKYDLAEFLAIFISVLLLLFGAFFLQAGIKVVTAKEKQEELAEKQLKEKKKSEKELEKSKIVKLEQKVKVVEAEQKKVETEKKELEKKVKEVEKDQKKAVVQEAKKVEKIDYSSKTLVELREIAKKRKLTGVSQLNKAELVAKLKE